jgi:hypothetical protein
VSDAKISRLIADSIAARPVVARLLSLAAPVLEQNMEIMEADRSQRWHRGRTIAAGQALAKSSQNLRRGQGLRLVHMVQIVTAALQPYADPRGSLAFNLHDPDFVEFKVDLARDLETVIQSLLKSESEI